MKLLYFAWLRERAGRAEEDIAPVAGVSTVQELVDHLRGQDERFEAVFGDMSLVRVAVNQEYVSMDHAVGGNDEIAFFPPVTGG